MKYKITAVSILLGLLLLISACKTEEPKSSAPVPPTTQSSASAPSASAPANPSSTTPAPTPAATPETGTVKTPEPSPKPDTEKKPASEDKKEAVTQGTGKQGGAKLGAKLFEENCSTCHEGGNNTIEPAKTLKLADLKANGFNGTADIEKRIKEGKAIMPSFEDKLKPEEIKAIAAYVWANAQKDWKK